VRNRSNWGRVESCISAGILLDSFLVVKHRKATRYRLGLKGVFHHAGESVGANVTIRDISTHGCELEHAQGSSRAENCELYFDWQGAHVGLEAEVVWKDPRGHAGLRFLRVDKHSQRLLNELCSSLSRQPPPRPQQKEAHAPQLTADPTHGLGVARAQTPVATPPSQRPQPASERSRRLVPRYVSELRGHLSVPGTDATIGVTVVSLSVSGASLQGSPLPNVGQACELQTDWNGRPILLPCKVVWKTKDEAGLSFATVEEETGKLLRRTLANLRLQPPGITLP
jgi:hypothetical protein